jgi:hypothetical protein
MCPCLPPLQPLGIYVRQHPPPLMCIDFAASASASAVFRCAFMIVHQVAASAAAVLQCAIMNVH